MPAIQPTPVTLETLPNDIKFILLENTLCVSYPTYLSLSSVSRTFRSVSNTPEFRASCAKIVSDILLGEKLPAAVILGNWQLFHDLITRHGLGFDEDLTPELLKAVVEDMQQRATAVIRSPRALRSAMASCKAVSDLAKLAEKAFEFHIYKAKKFSQKMWAGVVYLYALFSAEDLASIPDDELRVEQDYHHSYNSVPEALSMTVAYELIYPGSCDSLAQKGVNQKALIFLQKERTRRAKYLVIKLRRIMQAVAQCLEVHLVEEATTVLESKIHGKEAFDDYKDHLFLKYEPGSLCGAITVFKEWVPASTFEEAQFPFCSEWIKNDFRRFLDEHEVWRVRRLQFSE